jgi:hypothetical protein
MNAFLKKMSFAGVAFGGLFFAACGGDSGSSTIDLEDSFDMVLSKAHYDYDSDDSTLTVTYPVCKVGNLGNLVWKEEDPDSVFKYKSYLDKATALRFEKGITEPVRFEFDGGKFPVGFWSAGPNKKGDKFQMGIRYDKGDEVVSVIHYSGECYAQDFKANLFEDNLAIAQTEKALIDFYLKFQPADKQEIGGKAGEENILKNIRAADCDRLTMYDDLVSIEVDELKESSGELTVSYEDDECSLNFAIRYAINEDDCNAAYDEFKADKDAEEFNFADYSMKVEYDEYCVAQLVLNLKKDQGISLKKTSSLKSDSKEFAKGVVNLVVSGMK